METQVLTIKQFAVRYGLNPATVSAMVTRQAKKLPKFIRIGRQIRFPIVEVQKWEESQLNPGISQDI